MIVSYCIMLYPSYILNQHLTWIVLKPCLLIPNLAVRRSVLSEDDFLAPAIPTSKTRMNTESMDWSKGHFTGTPYIWWQKHDFRLRCSLSLCHWLNQPEGFGVAYMKETIMLDDIEKLCPNVGASALTNSWHPGLAEKTVLSLFLSHLYSQNVAWDVSAWADPGGLNTLKQPKVTSRPSISCRTPSIQIKDWKISSDPSQNIHTHINNIQTYPLTYSKEQSIDINVIHV